MSAYVEMRCCRSSFKRYAERTWSTVYILRMSEKMRKNDELIQWCHEMLQHSWSHDRTRRRFYLSSSNDMMAMKLAWGWEN